ncbi:MAG: hypothetical protein GY719_08315 [bacterium]|nr:hypothetical protein [bacterium]
MKPALRDLRHACLLGAILSAAPLAAAPLDAADEEDLFFVSARDPHPRRTPPGVDGAWAPL